MLPKVGCIRPYFNPGKAGYKWKRSYTDLKPSCRRALLLFVPELTPESYPLEKLYVIAHS